MKSTVKRNKVLSACTLLLIALSVLLAVWKTFWVQPNGQPGAFSKAWVPAGLSILLYLLLQFFITHPRLLVKKSLPEIEDPTLRSDEAVEKWKNAFYFLRLILVALITTLSFLN